jgi:hypothetical protein
MEYFKFQQITLFKLNYIDIYTPKYISYIGHQYNTTWKWFKLFQFCPYYNKNPISL